jgi:hypothetical protein
MGQGFEGSSDRDVIRGAKKTRKISLKAAEESKDSRNKKSV